MGWSLLINVLGMYSKLYYSRKNSREAKSSIEERKVLFNGFDLNDMQVCKYHSFYRFLVENLDRFAKFKNWINAGEIEGYNSRGSGPTMENLSIGKD
jgi:uncharacterized protein YfbU (UPF0304 family)